MYPVLCFVNSRFLRHNTNYTRLRLLLSNSAVSMPAFKFPFILYISVKPKQGSLLFCTVGGTTGGLLTFSIKNVYKPQGNLATAASLDGQINSSRTNVNFLPTIVRFSRKTLVPVIKLAPSCYFLNTQYKRCT